MTTSKRFRRLIAALACGIGWFAAATAARCESVPAAAKAAANPATAPEKPPPGATAADVVVARVNDHPIYRRKSTGCLLPPRMARSEPARLPIDCGQSFSRN